MRPTRSILSGSLAIWLLAVPTGATAQSNPIEPPAQFSGRLTCGTYVAASTVTEMPGYAGSRGGASETPVLSMSDDRLEGTWVRSSNWDEWGDILGVEVVTWRIEDEEGAWQGSDMVATVGEDTTIFGPSVLVGEGAYAGLNIVMQAFFDDGCGWNVNGMIIDGEVTPAPLPTTAD